MLVVQSFEGLSSCALAMLWPEDVFVQHTSTLQLFSSFPASCVVFSKPQKRWCRCLIYSWELHLSSWVFTLLWASALTFVFCTKPLGGGWAICDRNMSLTICPFSSWLRGGEWHPLPPLPPPPFKLMCVCLLLCVWHVCAVPVEDRRGHQNCLMWMPETEPGSSAGTANALNQWTLPSPALCEVFLYGCVLGQIWSDIRRV